MARTGVASAARTMRLPMTPPARWSSSHALAALAGTVVCLPKRPSAALMTPGGGCTTRAPMTDPRLTSSPSNLAAFSAERADPDATRRGQGEAERTLIVGLDGRQHDADALALARTLQMSSAGRLVFAHVIPPPPLGRGMVDYARQARSEGRELLVCAAERSDVPSETQLLETWPAAFALSQLAEDCHKLSTFPETFDQLVRERPNVNFVLPQPARCEQTHHQGSHEPMSRRIISNDVTSHRVVGAPRRRFAR